MRHQTIFITPADLWPGARHEDAAAVVAALRGQGCQAFVTDRLAAGQTGLAALLDVTDQVRRLLPTLIDEQIEAVTETAERARAAELRQVRATLLARQAEREAAVTAVNEAAERLAALEARP